MLTQRLRSTLEEYHRKKWFPDVYPDPFGEFIDYVSEGMIADLLAAWEKEKRGTYLDIAGYILQLLPEIQYREIFSDYGKALSQPLAGEVFPEFHSYWLRNLPEEKSSQLWKGLQNWSGRWETILSDWLRTLLDFEISHAEFYKNYFTQLHLAGAADEQLRSSRDLFAWEVQNKTKATDYRQLFRYFQLERWRNIADWKDLPALARSVRETCAYPKSPLLKKADNPAIQFVFPVLPPGRVVLEYGSANDPFDAMRFLAELGKGIFYASMNPELSSEERICGDPSLPWFWGYMFASLLVDPEGVRVFTGSRAEAMPEDTRFVLQCWYRRELFLTMYRNDAATDWKNVQDHYASSWELAFPLKPPSFLSLFELSHSTDSIFRWNALMRSQQVIKHLQMKYGRRWFTNRKWAERAREYWWEGFRLTTQDVLTDLQIQDPPAYPF